MHSLISLPRNPSRPYGRFVHVLLAFGTTLALAGSASAATDTFYANKDVSAKENHPDTNFGTEANVRISAKTAEHKEGFFQFSVSLPPGATNITAQLKCVSETTGTGRAISARAVSTTTWDELAVTWNTGWPTLGATLDTVSSHTSGADTVWNLGSYVTGNGEVAVGLSSAYTGDTVFTSREGVAGNASDPRLVVTYTVPSAVVTIAATDASASETALDPATFQVTSSAPAPAGGLIVNYTISGSAQKNHTTNPAPDYIVAPNNGTATTGSVTIAAAATTANITVTPIQDSHFEGTENVIFTLASGSGYTVGAARAAQTLITDNEPTPIVNPDHTINDEGGWIMPISGHLPNSECSGMAASRNYPGVLWYHRDGSTNEVREKMYAIEASNPTDNGTLLKTINLNQPANCTATLWNNGQWEDMSIDPDSPNYVWIANCGSNATPPTKNMFALFRIAEPDPYGSTTAVTPTAYFLKYPGGLQANAEIMFMFEGLPHIILKENNPRIYRAPTATLSTNSASPTMLEYVGTVVGGGNVSSVGTFSFDRRRFAIAGRLQEQGLWVWVSQSALDPVNNTLTPTQALAYIQDLLCTRSPVWALKHNGGSQDPETNVGSVEAGAFVGDGHDLILAAESDKVVPIPAWWYETQPAPIVVPPAAPPVNNSAPSISVTSPIGGATVSKAATPSLTLQAVASDYDGTISSVKFYQKLSSAPSRTLVGSGTLSGGAWSIAWNVSGATTGSYTLSADATDNSGGVTSASIAITLNP